MRLDLTLRYPAPVIASAAIHMASRFLNFPLPEEPYPWWKLMTDDYNLICIICDKILSLYHLPKLNWIEPLPDDVYYLSEEACKTDEPYIEEEIEDNKIQDSDDIMINTDNSPDNSYKPFHERIKNNDTKDVIIDSNIEGNERRRSRSRERERERERRSRDGNDDRKRRSRSRDRNRRSRSRDRYDDRKRRSRSRDRNRRSRSRSRSRDRYRRY